MKVWEVRFGESLGNKLSEVVLKVGTDVFTRRDIATKLGCVNVVATRKLHDALQQFEPKNVQELAGRLTVDALLRCEGVGMTTLYVWLNVLSYEAVDVEEWLNTEETLSFEYRKAKKSSKKKSRRF